MDMTSLLVASIFLSVKHRTLAKSLNAICPRRSIVFLKVARCRMFPGFLFLLVSA